MTERCGRHDHDALAGGRLTRRMHRGHVEPHTAAGVGVFARLVRKFAGVMGVERRLPRKKSIQSSSAGCVFPDHAVIKVEQAELGPIERACGTYRSCPSCEPAPSNSSVNVAHAERVEQFTPRKRASTCSAAVDEHANKMRAKSAWSGSLAARASACRAVRSSGLIDCVGGRIVLQGTSGWMDQNRNGFSVRTVPAGQARRRCSSWISRR